jgi:hypothetical protein
MSRSQFIGDFMKLLDAHGAKVAPDIKCPTIDDGALSICMWFCIEGDGWTADLEDVFDAVNDEESIINDGWEK